MEKKPTPKKKLTESAILENADLVTKIKSAQPGEPMSADEFTKWLANFQ